MLRGAGEDATFQLDCLVMEACGLCGFWAAGRVLSVTVMLPGLQSTRGTVRAPRRCVRLRIRAVQGLLDCECLFLLTELDDHLMEIEKKLTTWGYRENCVDIKLERAKIKR